MIGLRQMNMNRKGFVSFLNVLLKFFLKFIWFQELRLLHSKAIKVAVFLDNLEICCCMRWRAIFLEL